MIAAACNHFWRKKLVPKRKLASEPPSRWHGLTSNQSFKALAWLAWQEHLLQHQHQHPTNGDRLRTVRNSGEVGLFDRYLVDGFDPCDPVTHRPTPYEFHGCLTCFPKNPNQFLLPHADCTLQEVYKGTL